MTLTADSKVIIRMLSVDFPSTGVDGPIQS